MQHSYTYLKARLHVEQRYLSACQDALTRGAHIPHAKAHWEQQIEKTEYKILEIQGAIMSVIAINKQHIKSQKQVEFDENFKLEEDK